MQTKGYRDVIRIGNQTRPKLFDLAIKKPDVLYDKVVEVDERCIVEWPELIQEGATTSIDGHKLVTGTSGDVVRIIKPLDTTQVEADLRALYAEGFRSLAIVFMHSYTFRDHEQQVAEMAEKIGFEHVSQSSNLQAMIRVVPRANSASADAYLTPEIKRYLSKFSKGFVGQLEKDDGCQVSFMQSDGALVDVKGFSGLRAILSGPAGGVVGYATTCYDEKEKTPVVGFDMVRCCES
jgi:5-oxoprolinase (ATP-hydrolysing)